MRYKTRYSDADGYTIYRYFHYTPRQLGVRGFLATTCAAVTFFILIPLPDELFVIPAIAKSLQFMFPMDFDAATVYAYGVYKGAGLLFLGMTVLFGTQYLRDALLAKIKHVKAAQEKVQSYVQSGHRNLQQKLARKR